MKIPILKNDLGNHFAVVSAIVPVIVSRPKAEIIGAEMPMTVTSFATCITSKGLIQTRNVEGASFVEFYEPSWNVSVKGDSEDTDVKDRLVYLEALA